MSYPFGMLTLASRRISGLAHATATVLVGLVLLLVLAGCNSLGGKPTATLVGARLVDLSLDGVTLAVDIDVKNPTARDLSIETLAYSMTATSDELAQGPFLEGTVDASTMTDQVIPARSKRRITAPAIIAFTDVLDALDAGQSGTVVPWKADLALNVVLQASPAQSNQSENSRAATYSISSASNSSASTSSVISSADPLAPIALSMQASGRMPIPNVPKLEVGQIQWNDVGLISARGIARVKLTNTNFFVLDLKRVSYVLELQGASISTGGLTRARRLAPGEVADLEIPIRVSAAKVVAAIYEASRSNSANFRFKGAINLAADGVELNIPFDQHGSHTAGSPAKGSPTKLKLTPSIAPKPITPITPTSPAKSATQR